MGLAEEFSRPRQPVARAGVGGAHRREIGLVLAKAIGHGPLQVGRRGEGEEGVGLGDGRAGAGPADLPAGEREDLARRADLDRRTIPIKGGRKAQT